MGAKNPPMPFSDSRLKNILTHTFWFLPSVASAYAMRNLMKIVEGKSKLGLTETLQFYPMTLHNV